MQPHQEVQPGAALKNFRKIAKAVLPSKWLSSWKSDPPCPQLVLVTSNKLEEIMEQMRLNPAPTIYDFQGHQMVSSSQGILMTIPGGVTWRNGTIMLTGEGGVRGQGLVVGGANVVLTSVSIVGGLEGVSVRSGGSLTMADCKIVDCCCGVRLSGSAAIVASNLKMLNCSDSSFFLQGGSSADVLGCEVRGSYQGIYMNENSSFVGTRMSVTGVQGNAVSLHDGARLSLSGSCITEDPGKLGVVKDKASVLLFHCTVAGEFETDERASVLIKG